MTLFRYKKNGLLYTITTNGRGGRHKAYPYNHTTEIGVLFKNGRFRDFKVGMSMADFEVVAEQ